MKKFITLFLVLTGFVCSASATDYYFGANTVDKGVNWAIQGQMTDEDGDGTYSFIFNLPTDLNTNTDNENNLWFTVFNDNDINWSNALRPSSKSPWITNSVHAINMLEPGDLGYEDNGTICYPIGNNNDNNKNYASAIKVDYTPSTRTLDVTRLIIIASGYNSWSTTTDYITETSCGSKTYFGKVKLEDTSILDDGFKFVYINFYNNTIHLDYGAKKENRLSNEANNYEVDKDGVYDVTANFNTWDWTDPTLVTVPAAVGTYGMATFSSEYALDFTGIEEVKAYTITASNKTTGELTKNQVTGKVPAGTGLYIDGAANASVDVPTTIYTTSIGTNMLVAGTGAKIDPTDGTNTNFILTVNKADGTTVDTPKFFKVNSAGNTVLAGKAYLQIPTASVGARESFWFNEETAVNVVKQEQALDGQAYNLAGQRVAQPKKGLYIVNGKKVIIK